MIDTELQGGEGESPQLGFELAVVGHVTFAFPSGPGEAEGRARGGEGGFFSLVDDLMGFQ